MIGGLGMRTIWIALRAVNYTQRAFDQVLRNLKNLSMKEEELVERTRAVLKVSVAFIATGMMFTTMGLMMAQSLFNMAMQSQKGAYEMGVLQEEINRAKLVMADAVYDFLKASHVLDLLHFVLDSMTRNKYIGMIVAGFMAFVAVCLTAAGIILMLVGSIKALNAILPISNWHIVLFEINLKRFNLTLTITSFQLLRVALAINIAFGAFVLLMMITDRFGKAAGMVVSLAIAILGLAMAISTLKAVLSMGATLAQDITAFAVPLGLLSAGIAGMAYAASKQMGTRALPYTGLFYGHKGEVVYNPHTERPTMIAGDLERERPTYVNYDIPVTIENVHTKADFDDLDEQLRKGLRKAGRRRR